MISQQPLQDATTPLAVITGLAEVEAALKWLKWILASWVGLDTIAAG